MSAEELAHTSADEFERMLAFRLWLLLSCSHPLLKCALLQLCCSSAATASAWKKMIQ